MDVAVNIQEQTLVSTIDALWTLIQNQPKAIRKALTKRLVRNDVEAETYRQQLLVKQSLHNAFNELADAQRTGKELPNARNLFE